MQYADAVSAVLSAIDALGNADVDNTDVADRGPQLRCLKQAESKLAAFIARATHEADAAVAFVGTGARDTAEWLANETGTSVRKNRTAAELGAAMTKSESLADAVTSGVISTDKATALVGAASDETIDAELVAHVAHVADLPINAVKPAVEQWRARNHPDHDADVAQVQRDRRYLKVTDQSDGMTRIDGLLDPFSAAKVRTTLDGVMNESAFDDTGRSRDQRCADALTQLCDAASKGKIAGGRSNTKLLATASVETITERAADRGRTHAGTTLDAAAIRQLACDAGIHRVITGPASSILDFGHETRLVSENLFNALVVRDQHCRWPGCTIRATWCDAHHITEWSDDGSTDQDNCALLCHRHHQLSHQPGWTMTGTGTELKIERPDGKIEISKPPGVHRLRADTIGGHTRPVAACLADHAAQLSLV